MKKFLKFNKKYQNFASHASKTALGTTASLIYKYVFINCVKWYQSSSDWLISMVRLFVSEKSQPLGFCARAKSNMFAFLCPSPFCYRDPQEEHKYPLDSCLPRKQREKTNLLEYTVLKLFFNPPLEKRMSQLCFYLFYFFFLLSVSLKLYGKICWRGSLVYVCMSSVHSGSDKSLTQI